MGKLRNLIPDTIWNFLNDNSLEISIGILLFGIIMAFFFMFLVSDKQEWFKILANAGFTIMAIAIAMFLYVLTSRGRK